MAKRRLKSQHPRATQVASSRPTIHPNATIGPDASLESTTPFWKDSDSTNAPAVREVAKVQEYASTVPQLVEKFMHGVVPIKGRSVIFILTVAWFCFISWLFLQDNGSGKINDWNGLSWFGIKAGIYTGAFLLVAVLIGIYSTYLGK